jgi:cell division protein FtsA
LSQVSDFAHTAILAAERQADTQIDRMYLSLSSNRLKGFRQSGSTHVTGQGGVVSEADIARAVANAKAKSPGPEMVYLHHICNGYLLDAKPVDHPLGRAGSHLEICYWHVAAEAGHVREHLQVINAFGVDVGDFVISSIASGSIVASDPERQQGVLVVDIGKGTTDYVLYKGRRVVLTGVIPVGGEHVTNDLSLGLRTKAKYAESLKLRAARAMIARDDANQRVPIVGDLMVGDGLVSQLTINKITHARLEELFMILKNRLGSMLSRKHLPCGVILTGGVANTPQIDALAEVTLDVPVRIGQINGSFSEELRQPEYATVLGLLYNACKNELERPQQEERSRRKAGLLTRIFGAKE